MKGPLINNLNIIINLEKICLVSFSTRRPKSPSKYNHLQLQKHQTNLLANRPTQMTNTKSIRATTSSTLTLTK